MTIQLGTTLRNNMIGQYETTVGAGPKLQLFSGAQPANCAAADSGTKLAEITLPADWMTAPSNGGITLNGTWSGAGLVAGTAAHYRLKDSAGTTCHEQGSVTLTAGGGDLTLDNTNIAVSQAFNVTSWNRTQGGA